MNNINRHLLGLLFLPILIGIFFYVLGLFSPETIGFPTIKSIYIDFLKSFIDVSILNAILITSKYVLISTAISIIIGVAFSFLLNLNKYIWSLFEPFIDFLRSIPVTFFIPAFAVIFGVSSPNIIWVLAVIPSTLIIIVNVSHGLKQQNLSRLHQFTLLSGNNSRLRAFFKVTTFELIPFFISGFKIALSYTIVVVTVLEYMNMGSQVGLGTLVYSEMEQLNYKRVYSIIMIVGFIGFLLNMLIDKGIKEYARR